MSITERLRGWLVPPKPDERMLTPQQVWGSGGTWKPMNAAGVSVTAEAAMRAAIGRCIRLLADDISALPVEVIRTVGEQRIQMPAPDWVKNPSGRRWDTWPVYISDVVTSLLWGNTFVAAAPDTFRPSFLRVLDPAKVRVDALDESVWIVDNKRLSDAQVMHIPWARLPGKRLGMSVIDAADDTTGLELAARQWAGAFFRNGGTMGSVIQVPAEVGKLSQEQIDQLSEQFASRHEGSTQAWKVGVLTGGATMKDGALTPQNAELAPLWRQVLEEAAGLLHIPPHLLASQEPGAQGYASVEHRSIEYVQHAIVPIVNRIEAAHSLLLPGDDVGIHLNVNALLRGDVKTRGEFYQIMTSIKAMKPEQVAALEDLPPGSAAPGWLETPNNTPAPAAAPAATPQPDAGRVVVSDVELRDEAAAQLTERVTGAIAAGSEQASVDLAQVQADLISRTEDLAALVHEARQEARERVDALAVALQEDRLPIERSVVRDADGRISGVVERQGERITRKIVERDAKGGVIRILEAVA